jgi:hypothetical protein
MTKNKYRNLMDAVASLILRMSPIMPDFKLMCSLNSLICHTETLTHNNWYCFIGWLNRQRNFMFLFYLSTNKQMSLRSILILFLFTLLYCQLKNRGWFFVKYLSLEKGSIEENVWKALVRTTKIEAHCSVSVRTTVMCDPQTPTVK